MRYSASTTTSASARPALEVAALVVASAPGEALPALDRLVGVEERLEHLPLDLERARAAARACGEACRRRRPRRARPRTRLAREDVARRRARWRRARRAPRAPPSRSRLAHARVRVRARSTAAWSMPGSWTSAVYAASPRARACPSTRAAGRADDLQRPCGPLVERVLLDDDPLLLVRGLRPPSRCGSAAPRGDRLLDLRVRAAAAEVAAHARGGSRSRRRLGRLAHERGRRDDLAGRAEAALERVRRTNASTSGWSRRPSIVVTSRSPTAWASVMHESTGAPSRRTVQAPQWPSPQAIFVPVRPRSSRSASASVRPTGAVDRVACRR